MELSAAQTVPLICAAFNESIIQIWDLQTQQKTEEFATQFASGARNLALHPSGNSVVTGISTKNGRMFSYAVPGGELMWRCDRLSYPAEIRFNTSGEYFFRTLDNRRVEQIATSTGEKIRVFQDTIHYIEGPDGQVFIDPRSNQGYLLRGKHEISIPKLTFAVLDVAFHNDRLCITESGGPVRCLSYLTGSDLWRYIPPDGSHVLALHFNCRSGFFYGVLWHYEKGHFRYLVRFDAETGQVFHIRNLSSWEEVFCEATQQLITSSGEIVDLSSGEMVGKLAFPSKEYPDRFSLT